MQNIEKVKVDAATQILAHELSKLNNTKDSCTFGELAWRSNYGVFEYLPFYNSTDPYYFEISSGLKTAQPGWDFSKNEKHIEIEDYFIPNFDKGNLLFVPNISIFHKGVAALLVFILDRNTLSLSKDTLKKISKLYDGFGVEVYTTSADDVLSNVTDLTKTNFKKVLEK